MPQVFASTRISEGPASSRADGVTIVFGPMTIFRFSRIAARTSASHTKLTGFSTGGAAGVGSVGHCGASQPYPLLGGSLARRARNRSTTSAATLGITDEAGAAGFGVSHAHDGPPGAGATRTAR